MSDDVKQGEDVMTEEEQARANSREHLWRAAMWAGFAHAEEVVAALKAGQRPWFNELAPLNVNERVFVMTQICKYFFPEMTGENEIKAVKMLGKLYGVKRTTRMERRYAH